MSVYIIDGKEKYIISSVDDFILFSKILKTDKSSEEKNNKINITKTETEDIYIEIPNYDIKDIVDYNVIEKLREYILLHSINIDQERITLDIPIASTIDKLYKNKIDKNFFNEINKIEIIHRLYEITSILNIHTLENKSAALIAMHIKNGSKRKTNDNSQATNVINIINSHYNSHINNK